MNLLQCIMVVENQSIDMAHIVKILRDENYKAVVSATSSTEALQILDARQKAEAPAPELFLLDIGLGDGVDGAALCQQLRSRPEFKECPIIFITGLNAEMSRAFKAGADDFIRKPIDAEELKCRVKRNAERYIRNMMLDAMAGGAKGVCARDGAITQITRLGQDFIEVVFTSRGLNAKLQGILKDVAQSQRTRTLEWRAKDGLVSRRVDINIACIREEELRRSTPGEGESSRFEFRERRVAWSQLDEVPHYDRYVMPKFKELLDAKIGNLETNPVAIAAAYLTGLGYLNKEVVDRLRAAVLLLKGKAPAASLQVVKLRLMDARGYVGGNPNASYWGMICATVDHKYSVEPCSSPFDHDIWLTCEGNPPSMIWSSP